MAYIIETKNPFQPFEGLRKHQHPGGISIRGWLQMTYPGFIEFGDPTVCLVNGQPVLRRDWDREIKPNDIVNFVVVAGDAATIAAIVVIIVVIIAAIVVALVLRPPTPGTLPASDPVYSIKGQQNDIRLGEPIEVNYGRNRIYPSFAARPFFRYENNDQFQFSLFCIGQGQYEIHAIQIGDTTIADYEEVQYELLPPGTHTTLFHTNVHTAIEVGGQTLLGPNEALVYGGVATGRVRNAGIASIATQNPHGLTSGMHVKIIGFQDTSFNVADTGPINVTAPKEFSFTNAGPNVLDRKSTRLNSSHHQVSRMPSSA